MHKYNSGINICHLSLKKNIFLNKEIQRYKTDKQTHFEISGGAASCEGLYQHNWSGTTYNPNVRTKDENNPNRISYHSSVI
jgi:hypothetical protein